jgi:inner membrane protein
MPSIISHPAVPLAIGLGLGAGIIRRPLLIAGILASVVPDIDVLSFSLRVNTDTAFAHRGATHSFAFAALLALALAVALQGAAGGFWRCFVFLFLSTASHGVLDAFTNGGPGIAFFWPWTSERYFAPFRPILVSPIEVSRFLSIRGVHILISELIWLWVPCVVLWLALVIIKENQNLASVGTSLKRIFRWLR